MKNYLSFGGGVNSVAMMLLLLDEGVEFESVYVWMPDWPETHEYLLMLEEKGYPITVITAAATVSGVRIGNLYEYTWLKRMFPQRNPRWCTAKFKIETMQAYFQKPCFVLLGIDAGESHRARMSSHDSMENRYPLIERGITRKDCIEIIKAHDLPIPIKSGCYICPFQRISQLKQLRRVHPEKWCQLKELEDRNNEARRNRFKGKRGRPSKLMIEQRKPYYTWGKPVTDIINERDTYLFDDMAYPPCQCGL